VLLCSSLHLGCARDTAAQRSLEASIKVLAVLLLFVATLLGLQAIGLDVQSVLAISGFGGLALEESDREILEDLLNGLFIVPSRSVVVGAEIVFTQVPCPCCLSRSQWNECYCNKAASPIRSCTLTAQGDHLAHTHLAASASLNFYCRENLHGSESFLQRIV
jgi:hypothetical protein